tara:strand:+ start:7840 stop:8217 length:378 start_codon:yes stop_codon:yes gene_type:complete
MSYDVEIDDKAWDSALKRHEENWEKELETVDIRKVVLKTKKAVLEQARNNARCERATMDFDNRIKSAERDVYNFKRQVEDLETALKRSNESFSAAVKLLSRATVDEVKKKGFFRGFWEFLKCLMK